MDDALEIRLIGSQSPLERGPDGVVELLRVMDAQAGPFAPDQLFDKKLVPYSHATAEKMIAEARGRVVLRLLRSADPEASITFEMGRGGPVPFVMRAAVPLSWIAQDPEARTRAVVDFTRAMAVASGCRLGWAHARADVVSPVRADPFQFVDAHWLDVLGAESIESLGRDRVDSAQVVAREALPGGGVLLLTRRTPLDFATHESRQAQASAFAHLTGEDESKVLERLRDRSARLTRVDKAFDLEIADILDRLVDTEVPINRGREIERWNRFHPPPPSEQRPAAEQPPANVADPKAAISRYESLHAEQLIALLQPHLPEVVRAEPSSLPAIDVHFYRGDFPRHFERRDIENDLVPAVGGYLGMLLVKRLGGQWVPRENIDETAVIVGERAWLPFLRARHYLAAKDAALTHSLTQLYRAAARG